MEHYYSWYIIMKSKWLGFVIVQMSKKVESSSVQQYKLGQIKIFVEPKN